MHVVVNMVYVANKVIPTLPTTKKSKALNKTLKIDKDKHKWV